METSDSYISRVRTLMAQQREYFNSGETRDVDFRIKNLKTLRKSIVKYEHEILDALHEDLGKAPQESYFTELNIVLNEIKYHINNLEEWVEPIKISTPMQFLPSKSYVRKEPRGCVLIISPWSFPFHLSILPLIGAMSAGNCVILKPSPKTSATNMAIRKLLAKIFPKKYVAVLEGNDEEVEQLIHEKFDMIFYTGGKEFGKKILHAAAEHVTPVLLQLGGKTPLIIDDDSQIDLTAKRIAWGKFLAAGQTCVAPDYIFIKELYKDEFIKHLIFYIEEFYGKDPLLCDNYPHILNAESVNRLARYLEDGTVIYGGEYNAEARYFAPTIITDIKPDSPIAEEEILGPIVPIFTYTSIDEPINYINSRPTPLALYYFGDSKDGIKVMNRVQSGIACVNDVVLPLGNHHMPFGGVGDSGFGNYHGKHSFDAFSHERGYMVSHFRMDQIFKYVPFKYFSFAKRILGRD